MRSGANGRTGSAWGPRTPSSPAGAPGPPGCQKWRWPPGSAGPRGVDAEIGGGTGAAAFDYDELARRLLVQVVRRLAAAEPQASQPDQLGPDQLTPDQLDADQLTPDPLGPDQVALQETVTGLEYELATAWTKHGKLAEENVRLREQLRAAQRSLALAAERVRRLPVSSDLDRSEVVLLQRLLALGGPESLAEAPSLLS